MDTILTLEGEIGRENLSTQGKKRITTYHNLKKQVSNLEKAYQGADEKEKDNYGDELDNATEYLNNFRKSTIDFLQDELDDLKAKKKAKEEKLRLKKEREDKAQAETEAKAKKEKEEKQKIQADANPTDIDNLAKSSEAEEESKGSGITSLLFGGLVLVATLGAVNYFRNR
jgi:uncharacterized protein YhaN